MKTNHGSRWGVLFVATLLLAGVSGCPAPDTPGLPGEECNFEAPGDGCDDNSYCLNAICHKACSSERDCGGGQCATYEKIVSNGSSLGIGKIQACTNPSGQVGRPGASSPASGGGIGVRCQGLLAKADPAHSRTCGPGASARPPSLPQDLPCIRDSYVAAAIQLCWAAECLAELGKSADAAGREAEANTQLNNADQLCSSAPSFAGGDRCTTETFHGCQ